MHDSNNFPDFSSASPNSGDFDKMPSIGVLAEPRTFHQLGVFVMDGSGSMSLPAPGGITRAQAVNLAIRETLTRFKVSRKRDNFSFAMVTFDDQARVHTPPTSAKDIDDNADYDSIAAHGHGTQIATGVEEAMKLVQGHLAAEQPGGAPHTAIVLILTDGEDQSKSKTKSAINAFKSTPSSGQVIFACVQFAGIGELNVKAADHLKELSSNPVTYYKTAYDAETIRKFFVSSISAASGVAVG